MYKKFIVLITVLLLVLFGFACSSSTGSSNNPPDADFMSTVNSSVDDLSLAAAGDSSYSEHSSYDSLFGTNPGLFPLFQNYMNLYEDFSVNATYNSQEDRWEATVPDPEEPTSDITVYGIMSDNYIELYISGSSNFEVFFYPDEDSITINITGDPSTSNPHIRAELYKSGDYYYGFTILQDSLSYACFTKFKFKNIDPTDDFQLYYGSYRPLIYSNISSLDNPAVAEVDISTYPYLRDRTVDPDSWYMNLDDMYEQINITFDGTLFEATELMGVM
ncbi:MAG: hypothetical protein FXF47_01425 [Candidatus Mcinerneyibacterium aminivorans]|jgi:hypothetical protein|uniref:Uncharacterized protein n=1 Tax=Candidatus Mcinerneyibacterium aminivorans TaxID=2703815 RepID=A0A5D0MDZ2_9BACT|nr:MAG: hypothetical protein FXF47_01425 [Candidatus Mcinerneyibacterium aminivorans]